MSAILSVTDLAVHFPVKSGFFRRSSQFLRAVDGVSLSLEVGKTLGLVGESGCGKSTLGRAILRLYDPTAGKLVLNETDYTTLSQRQLLPLRRQVQMVFQDPFASLNPRHTVGTILEDPMLLHGMERTSDGLRERAKELLRRVGLPADAYGKFPHEFSGGQRQRIAIARAISLEPKVIVCDEAVSALDVSVQSQVLNLLLELQRDLGLSYLFISHDLAVVRHMSDMVAVMYLGQIVEITDADSIYRDPRHPYTQALLSAIPEPEVGTRKRTRQILAGDVPSAINMPVGCRFQSRCPKVHNRCRTEAPALKELSQNSGHRVACHLGD
jgi:oligopeptide/dipeptide ABC transporter ATP-binding protein